MSDLCSCLTTSPLSRLCDPPKTGGHHEYKDEETRNRHCSQRPPRVPCSTKLVAQTSGPRRAWHASTQKPKITHPRSKWHAMCENDVRIMRKCQTQVVTMTMYVCAPLLERMPRRHCRRTNALESSAVGGWHTTRSASRVPISPEKNAHKCAWRWYSAACPIDPRCTVTSRSSTFLLFSIVPLVLSSLEQWLVQRRSLCVALGWMVRWFGQRDNGRTITLSFPWGGPCPCGHGPRTQPTYLCTWVGSRKWRLTQSTPRRKTTPRAWWKPSKNWHDADPATLTLQLLASACSLFALYIQSVSEATHGSFLVQPG